MNVHVVCGYWIRQCDEPIAAFASRPMADAYAATCNAYQRGRPFERDRCKAWSESHPAGSDNADFDGFTVYTIPVKDAQ